MRKVELVVPILGLFVLLMVLFGSAVGTAENEVYLSPQDSFLEIGDSTRVEIGITAENYQGGQIALTYDPKCVNITRWERNTTLFPFGGWDSSVEGKERITFMAYSPINGTHTVGTLTLQCVARTPCSSSLEFTSSSGLFDPSGEEITVNWMKGSMLCWAQTNFDTGAGTYPSIPGIFNGTIKPKQTIIVSKLSTHASPGTGGHTEFVRIWNSNLDVNATWGGYEGDWHTISFTAPVILYKNETYNYTMITGSYPGINHNKTLLLPAGEISCTDFTDINGQVYEDRIPAIRLFLQ